MCSRRTALCALLAATLAAQEPQPASPPTEAELVALAFPECTVVREEVLLDEGVRGRVRVAADTRDVPERIVRHTAERDGKVVGRAYVDTRRVRTHGQSLLVCVDADGEVARVEVLAFGEPRQYRPRANFLEQFLGLPLGPDLRLRRAIRPVAGATLTANATVDAVRTVLAVHEELGAAK